MSHLMNMNPALLGAISGRKGPNAPIAEMTKKQAQRALNKAVARATVTGDGGAFMASSSTGKRIDRLARHVEKKQKQQDIRKLARTLVPNVPAQGNTNTSVQNDDDAVTNNTGNGSGSGGGGDGGGGFTFSEGGGSAEDTLFSSLAPTNDPNAPAGTVQVGPDGQPVEASAGGGKFILIGAAALAAWFFLRKKRGRRK